jgi:hypothetical protein
MARKPTWTCTKVEGGVKCGHANPRAAKKCQSCGKLRPPVKRAAHQMALQMPYEYYVEINGGEFCGICKRPPSARRRLDRDHDHRTAKPRGLLCPTCNRNLWTGFDAKWAMAALEYLEKAEKRLL